MSPGMAFGYLFWTECRRGPIVLGGLWLVLAILCRILPIASLPSSILIAVLGIPGMFTLAVLMGVFMFPEKNPWMRPESRESCFPSRLWVLPLRTWALVSWPMLWGIATLALFWLAWAVGILRPCGFKAPLVWPFLLLAAVLAWLQALAWSPFPLPWLRMIVGMPIVFAFELIAILLYDGEVPEGVCCGVLIVLLAMAYVIAIGGVARARRGDVPKWGWPRWLRPIAHLLLLRRRQPPLSSPMQAQRWLEWRRGGRIFPINLGLILLVWLPCVPWFAFGFQEAPLARLSPILPLLLREVGSLWLAMGSLLPIPFSLAWAAGIRMGPLPGQDCMSVLSSFMATRPISCWDLIRAKLQTAALSTLAGWAVVSVGLLLWAAFSGYGVEMAMQFEAMRQHYPAGRFWATLILLLGGSLLLTWMQMAGHLWVGHLLAGLRQEVWRRIFIVLVLGVLLVAIIVGQRWEEIPDPWQMFADLLPWLAGGVVALKCLAAAWALNRLKRNTLVPPHVLIGVLATWFTLAIVLFVVLRWLIPHEIVPTSGLILGIVLLLPLTRLALAPLTLAWNRHR